MKSPHLWFLWVIQHPKVKLLDINKRISVGLRAQKVFGKLWNQYREKELIRLKFLRYGA